MPTDEAIATTGATKAPVVRMYEEQPQNTIFESDDLNSLLPLVEAGDLVIFDLDNNVIHSDTYFGSDQWFEALFEAALRDVFEPKYAVQYCLGLYHAAQFQVGLSLQQQDALAILDKIKAKGAKVIALTARGHIIADVTLHKLKQLGIEFGPDSDRVQLFKDKHSMYKSGVIFCDGEHKGECLRAYLEKMKIAASSIRKVLMSDDKLKNLQAVQKTCEETLGIPFRGLRNSKADNRFDMDKESLDLGGFAKAPFMRAKPC